MSFQISIIGIDGSGKSTATPALANLVTAELGLTTIAVGDACWGQSSQESLFQPGYMPDGKRFAMRLGGLFRRGAKATTVNRQLYPLFKLVQLALQERTARQLAATYQADVVFSDGSLLLSSAGRAVNYTDSEHDPVTKVAAPSPPSYIQALYDYVFAGTTLPQNIAQPGPGLKLMRWFHWLDQQFNLELLKLPDAVIFLDIAPKTALVRLKRKSEQLDHHENLYDLTQAQLMYRGVIEFFRRRRGDRNVVTIDVTSLSTGQVLKEMVDFVHKLPLSKRNEQPEQKLLGKSDNPVSGTPAILKKALSYRYLARYTLPNIRQGSLHELTFPLSNLGRLSLKEGYSARVMRAIYLQKSQKLNPLDRIFLNYPLHQAIYHRLQTLDLTVEREFRRRLAKLSPGETIKVLTAPSGYALDLFLPLQRLNQEIAGSIPVEVLASDLDPDGDIQSNLFQTASSMDLDLKFRRGDLTSARMRETFKQSGPYDVVFFVGLSGWISRVNLANHLKLIRHSLLMSGGTLFIDCFTPQAFALSGKYIGYKLNYYSPCEFTNILDYCGFDPANLTWISDSQNINHVCVAHTATLLPKTSSRPICEITRSSLPTLQTLKI